MKPDFLMDSHPAAVAAKASQSEGWNSRIKETNGKNQNGKLKVMVK